MANHEMKSLELLDEVEQLEKALLTEYAGAKRSWRVADLQQRINRCLKKADIHATHALRQAVEDAGHVGIGAA
jgi:hypothetical protein